MTGRLVLDVLTWWHCGTGRGDGLCADAIVARTPAGLPHVPGRTVKGLVRAAVHRATACGLVTDAQRVAWFGQPLPSRTTSDDWEQRLEAARHGTQAGTLRFESATLGPVWEAWARQHPGELGPLFTVLASTSIDPETRTAAAHTLRQIEAAAPMTLVAEISGLTPVSRGALMEAVPLFLTGLGSHRNRGFGRVAARVEAV